MNNRIDLARHFNNLGFNVGAEIGVADGRFSEALCKSIPGLKLYCVDPWTTYKGNRRGGGKQQHDANFASAQARLLPYDAHLLRGLSSSMAPTILDGSLDFVFIDGNHDYEYVLEDLFIWSKKVRKGGIVSGHDYYHFNNSGVIEAVDAYVYEHDIDLQIIGEVRKHARDDDQPCFWWVK